MDRLNDEGSQKVSIIIRTKNEETWISQCLSAVYAQSYKNIEVVVVDNNSTDSTLVRCKEFPVKIRHIDEFYPGRAINLGVKNSDGELIVCLSGHCVPAHENWLEELIKPLKDEDIAGVYGRQLPTTQTNSIDSRDLYLVFGVESRVQKEDTFFHNANSAFRRSIWEKYEFDNNITNVEDRLWGERVIEDGYKIYYSSKASVFHWHGIHHNQDIRRADKIHSIVENMKFVKTCTEWSRKHYIKRVCAFLPIMEKSYIEKPINLLEHTLIQLVEMNELEKIYISSDSKDIIDFCESINERIIGYVRSEELSKDRIPINGVIEDFVDVLDRREEYFDYIACFQINYPLRNMKQIREMIRKCTEEQYETGRAIYKDMRYLNILDGSPDDTDKEHFKPKSERKTMGYIELPGYCLITTPSRIRTRKIYKQPIWTTIVNKTIETIAVHTKEDLESIYPLLK